MKTINNFLSLYAKKTTKSIMRAGLYAFLEYVGNVKRKVVDVIFLVISSQKGIQHTKRGQKAPNRRIYLLHHA